ncbi:hypothetical protein FB381_3184 [Nocardioides albertanoniae]|uniref:Uncharacterized protein n=1 Tax=Nocardioides albertanoniae TaxID=1175486 RepID=A0A543A9Q5_9ACTN|nr:hypothetical protein [Nocardioides albertanoniae]TQL69279.1 hypothetical protein FB381_3184 [Nocardioides albertanoniae]
MAHLTGEVWVIAARNGGNDGSSGGIEDRPWARWFARSGSLQVEPREAGEQARTLLTEDGQTAALRFNERVLDTLTGDLAGLVEYVTVLDGARADEVLDTQKLIDNAFARVSGQGIERFVAWLAELRVQGHPAIAVQALHAYGRHADVDLAAVTTSLEFTADRVILIAAAALHRSPEDAARLAIETEHDGSIAYAVIHDVLRQRTVPDIARFLRALHLLGATELVNDTVKTFAATSSGRSNLDKAVLYVALNASPRLQEIALDLLWRTLGAIGDRGRAPGHVQQQDLVAAFWELCPGGRVLEDWFKVRLDGSENAEEAREQVVVLLRGSRGPGRDSLLGALAGDATPMNLKRICETLMEEGDEAQAAMIVRALAHSGHIERLGDFLDRWSWAQPSSETTRKLLHWVLTPEGTDREPMGSAVVEGVAGYLADVHGKPLGEDLRRQAATLVRLRPAEEIVGLLGHVPSRVGRRGRSAVAADVGWRLAEDLLVYPAPTEEAYVAWYAECLAALEAAGFADAVRTSWHHLADEAINRRGAGPTIAEAAHQLRRNELTGTADRLLTRYLDQAQSVTPSDIVGITTRLRLHRYPEASRAAVLRRSVGRWQDRARIDAVVETLVAAGQEEEAEWVSAGSS